MSSDQREAEGCSRLPVQRLPEPPPESIVLGLRVNNFNFFLCYFEFSEMICKNTANAKELGLRTCASLSSVHNHFKPKFVYWHTLLHVWHCVHAIELARICLFAPLAFAFGMLGVVGLLSQWAAWQHAQFPGSAGRA